MAGYLCPICEDEYVSQKRWNIGHHCCLTCGDQEAYEQAKIKAKRVGLNYNKGQYQYITDGADLTELGKK